MVPAGSRALPGSVNSADAPQAPRVQTNRNALTTFRDAQHGLSFQYPSSWRPLVPNGAMAEPDFTAELGPALGSEAMLAGDTPLADTNMIGISFSWTVKTKSDPASCARLAADALPMGTEQPGESFHGVTFQRGSGSDSGMCHHVTPELDTTFRGGKCYIFERDLETTCPDIKTPSKDTPLRPAQRAALQRSLDAVMGSVTLQ